MGRSMQEVLIFDAFMRHTSDSIVIKEYFANERGEFTKAGHYGLSMDTIRGLTDFDLMPRKQANLAFQDDIWVMKHRRPIEDQRETITHKNGEEVKVSVTKFPWILPGGEIVGVMCIARNITIREQAKQQSRDLLRFMRREVLQPLLPMYQTELKYTETGKVLKTMIARVIRKLTEGKSLKP
jgi:PAS domain S-box-containing protein